MLTFWVMFSITSTNSTWSCRAKIKKKSRTLWRDFQRKLTLFSAYLWPGKMLHFPKLHNRPLAPEAYKSQKWWRDLWTHWKPTLPLSLTIFSIPPGVMRFVKDSFCVNVEREFVLRAKEWVMFLNEASLQLTGIQSSDDLRHSFQSAASEKFWTLEVRHKKIPQSKGLFILFILTMFGSTFTCKSSFSHMSGIKTNNHTPLTASPHCMMLHSYVCVNITKVSWYSLNNAIMCTSCSYWCCMSHVAWLLRSCYFNVEIICLDKINWCLYNSIHIIYIIHSSIHTCFSWYSWHITQQL